MKSIFILIGFCSVIIYAAGPDSLNTSEKYESQNTVYIDGLILLFGAINPGFERVLFDEFSVYGSVGFGDLWFTDLNTLFDIGLKYRLKKQLKNNFYLSVAYVYTDITYKDRTALSRSLSFSGGYYHIFFDFLKIDGSAGIYISGDPMVKFTEHSGNLEKTVTVGGAGFGASIKVGITF